jgi:hypothetical protein
MSKTAFAAAAMAVALAWAQPARAQGDAASCTISEIEASNGEGGVDPALKPLERKLKKPPFSSWKTFKLLASHTASLTKGKAVEQSLAPGGSLSLLYAENKQDKDKKMRLRLKFSLDDKDGKRTASGTINIDSGDYAIVGGQKLPSGGTFVIAFSCTAD